MYRTLLLLSLPALVLCQFNVLQWLTAGGGVNSLQTRCQLPMDPGQVRGNRLASNRFFFNSTSGECEMFYHNGRGGNRNNFRDIFSCMRICGCKQPMDGGVPCFPHRQPVTGYYFNGFMCEQFQHTGCGGNSNHFSNMFDCLFVCGQRFD